MSLITESTLLPAIVQDALTGQVLMLGYTNLEAQRLTDETGWIHFYSRSRNALWLKGETSGNRLKLISKAWDCDQDTLLYCAVPLGPTCHTGSPSCFSKDSTNFDTLLRLESKLKSRVGDPLSGTDTSYTQKLFKGTKGYMIRKLLEEAAEVSDAFVENQDNLADEAADLLYHLIVLLIKADLPLEMVFQVLSNRDKSNLLVE